MIDTTICRHSSSSDFPGYSQKLSIFAFLSFFTSQLYLFKIGSRGKSLEFSVLCFGFFFPGSPGQALCTSTVSDFLQVSSTFDSHLTDMKVVC